MESVVAQHGVERWWCGGGVSSLLRSVAGSAVTVLCTFCPEHVKGDLGRNGTYTRRRCTTGGMASELFGFLSRHPTRNWFLGGEFLCQWGDTSNSIPRLLCRVQKRVYILTSWSGRAERGVTGDNVLVSRRGRDSSHFTEGKCVGWPRAGSRLGGGGERQEDTGVNYPRSFRTSRLRFAYLKQMPRIRVHLFVLPNLPPLSYSPPQSHKRRQASFILIIVCLLAQIWI